VPPRPERVVVVGVLRRALWGFVVLEAAVCCGSGSASLRVPGEPAVQALSSWRMG